MFLFFENFFVQKECITRTNSTVHTVRTRSTAYGKRPYLIHTVQNDGLVKNVDVTGTNLLPGNNLWANKKTTTSYQHTHTVTEFMLRWSVLCWIALSLTTMTASENVDAHQKTVYLIRHAESEENRRLASFSRAMNSLGKFSLPNKKDVCMASGLMNISAQVDSNVSKVGEQQIEHVAAKLRQDQFLVRKNVTLVAHSPLKRARQTSEGMLGAACCFRSQGTHTDNN